MQQEYVGLLIAAARRRIKQAVLVRTASHKLASQQFWFLNALLEHPGLSQVDLAERAHADAPTASRVVSGLTRRRLVRAEPDPRDRRRVRLTLTASGERVARELATVAAEIRAAVVDGMTEEEIETLRAGLRHVIANLDRLAAAAPVRRAAPRRARGQS